MCDRVEDRCGDLAQRIQQEIHGRVSTVVAESGTVGDRDPLGHPPCGGQLAARRQRPLGHQREQHPLGRAAVDAPTRRHPVQRRADAKPLPQPVQHPRPTEAARVQHLDLAGVRGRDRLLRVQNREIDDTSRASPSRSTASARPKLWITFACGTPVTGWRSLYANCRYDTVDPSRLRRLVSRRYTPTPLAHIHW